MNRGIIYGVTRDRKLLVIAKVDEIYVYKVNYKSPGLVCCNCEIGRDKCSRCGECIASSVRDYFYKPSYEINYHKSESHVYLVRISLFISLKICKSKVIWLGQDIN